MSQGDPSWSVHKRLAFSFAVWGIYKNRVGGEYVMLIEQGHVGQLAASQGVVA